MRRCGCGPPNSRPVPRWAQLCWVPTPGRMLGAGAGQGCPEMRFLGSNLNWWHLRSRGTVPGLAGDSPGSPGWQPGPPFSRGGVVRGCLSLHWLQGEPRHRAKPRCAFYPGMKVGKAYGDDVLPRGPADWFGDSWGKAAKSTRFFFFFSGEAGSAASQRPGGCLRHGRCLHLSTLAGEGNPARCWPVLVPAHLLPPCSAARTSPPWQEDGPVLDSCCVGVLRTGAGLLVTGRCPKVTVGWPEEI